MAYIPAPRLYIETRLNLDPADAIKITLPADSSPSSTRSSNRTIVAEDATDQDEVTFSRRHLASEASIHFRRGNKHPRSFLWRLLDDRRVLEIQSVDLSQDPYNKGEAILTLLLEFPNAIRPFSLAFADANERDALNVFALTTSNRLYTLTLPKNFFVLPTASELEVREWCHVFLPSSFSFRHPYRLVATSAQELLISLHDGGLLRLTRKTADHGSGWRETFFTEGSWSSSLRGLIPWKGHNTVRYGDVDLEANTAASIALSPDGQHIWTVCLNHTLKAWNVRTGRIGVHTDLLGDNHRDPQNASQYLIGAGQPKLMQLVDVQGQDGELYYVVTYSPKLHQFKFWAILEANSPAHGIRDIQSDIKFIPPVDELMDTTVWNMEEFYIKTTPGWRQTELWIRARSGASSKVYNLKFDLFDEQENLRNTWRSDWTAVSSGFVTAEGLTSLPDYPANPESHDMAVDVRSISERWLDFLFYPGRFTVATLETALWVYRGGVEVKVRENHTPEMMRRIPLKERLCTAIESTVPLVRSPAGDIDYEQYEMDLSIQWQIFYGLVRDLHKRRGEALALVLDPDGDLPWLLAADCVSVVRRCSEIELLRINGENLSSTDGPPLSSRLSQALLNNASLDVASLLRAARIFRSTFSAVFQEVLNRVAMTESLHEPNSTVPVRIQSFDERCNLCARVSDDDFTKLTEVVDELGGFDTLTTDLFLAALERLDESQRGHQERQEITRFGAKALIRGAQDTLKQQISVLVDLLVLVVFMALEIEPADLSKDFDAPQIFVEILSQLKEHSLLHWLASTMRQERSTQRRGSKSVTNLIPSGGGQALSGTTTPCMTLLESMFIGDWSSMLFPQLPQSLLITYWCRSWTFGAQLLQQYDAVAADIMGNLLKHRNVGLALDFLPFLPRNAWGTYLQARLHLMNGEYTLASVCFKKSAFALAMGHFDVDQSDSTGLLNPEEREHFSEGLTQYYQHVLSLFDKLKLHSFVAEFAMMAMQSIAASAEEEKIRTEILSRLFTACIHTSRFDEAYSALVRYTNPILRKSALTTLITTMIAQQQTPALLRFPFTGIQKEVDAVLSSLCQKTLNVITGPPYHKILYAWRVARNDFRGAASALHERLQRLQTTSSAAHGQEDESIAQEYLLLINTLASVEPEQAWILAEQRVNGGVGMRVGLGNAKGKTEVVRRKAVTLEDVRREYQMELDRVAAMENGRFAFNGGGEMDVL